MPTNIFPFPRTILGVRLKLSAILAHSIIAWEMYSTKCLTYSNFLLGVQGIPLSNVEIAGKKTSGDEKGELKKFNFQ